ncbi:YdhR family protein [Leisingera sp. McT4-56]|nr:YdhR family protein [Leisingera sp. McT4-56]
MEAYKAMHIPRLNAIGIEVVSDHVFDVMEELSQINRAPVGTSS